MHNGVLTFQLQVPTARDDTKLIDGYPEEKVIVARKKGKKWYIAGLNGKDAAQTLLVKFDFLVKEIIIFSLSKTERVIHLFLRKQ